MNFVDAGEKVIGPMTTRIGMMLPGAVSLGAYEGGALAAVLKAVQASRGQLVIDAIASASAGSMTALIAARALLSGADPIDLMVQTWVILPQLEHLQTHDLSAPLAMTSLINTADSLLGNEIVRDGPDDKRQQAPVHLSMALTALGGLTYTMSHLRDAKDPNQSQALLATTYVDFFTTRLDPGATTEDFRAVRDAAMASGSTPIGFPARWLDRSSERAQYVRHGVQLPSDKPLALWYSDGGDIDNQPFGRLLDVIGDVNEASDDERVIVALNIEPAGPPAWAGTWFDSEHQPSWLATLLHVDHIRSVQSMYDDLRRLEKTNKQIEWVTHIGDSLQHAVGEGDIRLSNVVSEAAEHVASDREGIRRSITGASRPGVASEESPPSNFEELLLEAAGLTGKKKVVVELISPDVDSDPGHTLTADQQLSGEFLFHFGGFFDQRYRESDFALGYRNARNWLGWWLTERVDNPGEILAEVDRGYEGIAWRNESHGNTSVTTLSFKEKVEGIDLVEHIGRVVGHDLRLDVTHGSDDAPSHTPLDERSGSNVLERLEDRLHHRDHDSR